MSAVTFGIFAFIMFFVLGILRVAIVITFPVAEATFGESSIFESVIATPILGGIMVFLFFLLVIVIYNKIAKKYPITWEVKK
jgi:hypothetical protein